MVIYNRLYILQILPQGYKTDIIFTAKFLKGITVMDKYIEVLCKQNPKISFPCGNPECKKEHTFNSKDVFKKKIYEFKCTSCGKITELDTSEFVKNFVSTLKKMGITVK